MAFGILEDKHFPDGNVPGTALLDDHDTGAVSDAVVSHLKKGTGRYSHIILQPQPDDSPRDPLNWPRWKKELCFLSLNFFAGLVGACGPLISTGYVTLAPEIGVSESALVTATNSDLILALGCIMIFFAPIATKIGRRPCYLLGSACMFASAIGAAVATNLTGLKIARIFQGFAMAPFEALVVSTIGDIYFVHERGFRTAIWGLALSGGIALTPIINGVVIDRVTNGWKLCFWLLAAASGAGMIAIFFFVPETAYDRQSMFDTDAGHSVNDVSAVNAATEELEKSRPGSESDKPTIEHVENGVVSAPTKGYLPAKTFVQELRPYSGYWSTESFAKLCIRPFPFFASPVVIFAFFAYGMTTCWSVVLSVLSSIIFAAEYNFDATSTGYTSIGGLVTSIIMTFIAGPACDWVATYFARRNHGKFEPEFRLYLLVPMVIFEVAAFTGWAAMVKAGNIGWIGPVFMLVLLGIGQSFGSVAVVTYVLDVHRKQSPEAFAVINLSKNLCLYGISSVSVEWIDGMGLAATFNLLAGLSVLCIGVGLPMYIFGKRVRSFVARHEAMYLAVDNTF